ncbi:hypothetical protein SAMN05443574_1243 [Haloarcula vallismortis]|uniref:Uncharacterized protein n=2 Tax=Haloarcula vallismortis TaxID=28442 RepID=M0JLF0_HALVA|nr:hypothetical protein [Haloarcula vallismortis]EMA09967.1 hypothetical protein C437_04900 [Haloarcula vallismortis ATCC 29715]SDX27577.1 hypothetical protein SAMN05443574_1243 [Haloarcula vallismortis]
MVLETEELKTYAKDAWGLFNEHVDIDDPVHQFGLVVAVLLPTYILTSGNNPFAGIPLYQLAVLAAVILILMYTDFGEDLEFGSPVEEQGSPGQRVSAKDVQVYDGD